MQCWIAGAMQETEIVPEDEAGEEVKLIVGACSQNKRTLPCCGSLFAEQANSPLLWELVRAPCGTLVEDQGNDVK